MVETLITEHLDTWTAAIKAKSSVGRGSGKKRELYGIKKLRELILELAVRGLLVPQDPNDEPASELLKKIAVEKAKLIKQGKLKKQKKLPEIGPAEKPFSIPLNWGWVRLGNATNYGICDKAEATDVDEHTWVLELEDVEKSTSKLLKKVQFRERNFKSSKNRFNKSDVIYGKLRPYLDKVLVADEPGVCTTEMIPIRAHASIEPAFLRLTLKSPYFIRYANDSTHGMNLPRMGTDKARVALIPLAPEAEQRRIVAKVDELMALCDQLELRQEDSLQTHQTLVKTLLGALTSASDPDQFSNAWKMIASNFDTLFTTESSIDELKQTILQLAVMGKLVEQNPNDKPEINQKNTDLYTNDSLIEAPFPIPVKWKWMKLDRLTSINGGFAFKSSDYNDGGVRVVRISDFDEYGFKNDKIVRHSYSPELEKFSLIDGDILMAMTGGTVGKSLFVRSLPEPMIVNQRVATIRTKAGVQSSYINILIQSELTQQVIHSAKNSTNDNISMSDIKGFYVPLPPLSEQHRIVAKVDELMALCDRLKAGLQTAQTTQLHLADTLVESAIH
jgi:type I restriction enzyme S subunit